jgi:ubiquinol-cytochrome c reductase subunit 8
MRQRAAHNLFRNYLFNGYRRLASHVPYWIVPVAIGE